MQTGHFLLFHDEKEDKILPCIGSELDSKKHSDIIETYGHFPTLTWDTGIDLLSQLNVSKKLLLVLVNDWQHIPPTVDRNLFYKSHKKLPSRYLNYLEAKGNGIQLLEPQKIRKAQTTAPFFGEMNLRNKFRKRMAKLIKEGLLPSGLLLEQADGIKSCVVQNEQGQNRQVYCSEKTGDCATEVAQLCSEISTSYPRATLINIFPAVCKDHVEAGTEYAFDLFKTPLSKVINVSLPSTGVTTTQEILADTAVTIHKSEV